MGPDDDDSEDEAGFGPPLPPDDRLWRHPSELREHGGLAGGPVRPLVADRTGPNLRTVALTSALAGAVLTAGLIALVGFVSPRSVDNDVVQKVALEPIVSVPMVRGDLGVTEVTKRLEPAIVRIDADGADRRTGSGVLFRDDGLVLTSAHVVRDADALRVRLSDGRQLEGRLVGTDPLTDLAVVDLDGGDYPVAVLGTAKYLEVGATAVALGSSQSDHGDPTVFTGVVSALGSSAQGPDQMLHGLIQTDSPVWGNCSGGALVDAAGAVIGITSAAAGGSDRGVAYATPIDVARWVAGQIVAHGRMTRGWLGIEGTTLPDEGADALGVQGGAIVRDVHDGSPAAAAGLDADDVITNVDGHDIESIQGLVVELRDHEPGDSVEITYWRDGRRQRERIELDERPAG
ncbi:MAG: S1C family serine protease [Actinomycetota bacterium]|nr:S1C family serine protease [Actinomycetota bacterium]